MKAIRVILVLVVVLVVGFLWEMKAHGISTRSKPTTIERVLARAVRNFAIPGDLKEEKNPVPSTPEVIAKARAHFADHCAQCHGNDGRGDTEMGRHLYPKAPDMTASATQSLSDGELFAIITNGVRLTGMPAWGDRSAESNRETWELVDFIRHLPKLTDVEIEEMKKLNPRGPAEWKELQEENEFLSGSPAPDAGNPQ